MGSFMKSFYIPVHYLQNNMILMKVCTINSNRDYQCKIYFLSFFILDANSKIVLVMKIKTLMKDWMLNFIYLHNFFHCFLLLYKMMEMIQNRRNNFKNTTFTSMGIITLNLFYLSPNNLLHVKVTFLFFCSSRSIFSASIYFFKDRINLRNINLTVLF